MNKPSLDERRKKILKALVRIYIQTGEPVGSARLYKAHRFGVSAATIRNILSELEKEGYLTQPHTSAGRVPSDIAYRFFVDSISDRKKLPPEEIEQIRQSLSGEDSTDKLMMRTSHLLSATTRNLAIVVSPPNSQITLKHIEFIKLDNHRLLVVLIASSSHVQHKVVKISEEFSQEELNQASRYLSETFQGKTFDTIGKELLVLMSQEQARYNTLLKKATVLWRESLSRYNEEKSEEVYLEGASHLMAKPEFSDAKRLQELLRTIEEKGRLVKLISACIDSQPYGLTILIGRETNLEEMENCTLIAAPLGYGDVVVGSVGILGSTRMEYEKAIMFVEGVAKVFGNIVQGFNA
ncbi:MAG: heat-inducible transcription repressor HrcA [Acidobacteria bacterium]|nr:heat-inducible transcription repressor HrcA [Acidobacteriota bacterium]MBI3655668.1 heat-inducible transcription repressor HrcA [Acidobacteriota bacterium]